MILTNTTSNDIALSNIRLDVARIVIPAYQADGVTDGTFETLVSTFWPFFWSPEFLSVVTAGDITVSRSGAGDVKDADDDFNTRLKSVLVTTLAMNLFNA